MSKNIVFRFREHLLACVGVFFAGVFFLLLALCRSIWSLPVFLFYGKAALMLRLTEFPGEKKRRLIPLHFALSLGVSAMAKMTGISGRSAALLLLLLNAVYVLWLVLAEGWMHLQIGAVSTLLIDGTGTAREWAERNPRIYHVAEGFPKEDIFEIEKHISIFRIPMILTEKEPSSSLMAMARRLGVIVHYISADKPPVNQQMTEVHRYKGLYTYTPDPW